MSLSGNIGKMRIILNLTVYNLVHSKHMDNGNIEIGYQAGTLCDKLHDFTYNIINENGHVIQTLNSKLDSVETQNLVPRLGDIQIVHVITRKDIGCKARGFRNYDIKDDEEEVKQHDSEIKPEGEPDNPKQSDQQRNPDQKPKPRLAKKEERRPLTVDKLSYFLSTSNEHMMKTSMMAYQKVYTNPP
jgi:hypothetical protein